MKITSDFKGQMRWQSGEGTSGVVMDATSDLGGLGEGPSPKELVLHSLAGCTGLDVVAILTKKKVPFGDFSIDVEAEQTNTYPKMFKAVNVIYRIEANPDDRSQIERAIVLSKGQFCGVSAMLAKSAKLSWDLQVTPL